MATFSQVEVENACKVVAKLLGISHDARDKSCGDLVRVSVTMKRVISLHDNLVCYKFIT